MASIFKPNALSARKCGSIVRVPSVHPPAYGKRNCLNLCKSGPINIKIERVLRAASTLMCSISNSSGDIISKSRPSFTHRHRTPKDSKTSIIRNTSSIRAKCFSVVVPEFKIEAHSKATAAFLLVLIVASPCNSLPP